MKIRTKVKQYNKSKRSLGRKCHTGVRLVKRDELEEKEKKQKDCRHTTMISALACIGHSDCGFLYDKKILT